MKKRVWIDADSIVYQAAHQAYNGADNDLAEAESLAEEGEELGLDDSTSNEAEEAQRSFMSRINSLMSECKAEAKRKNYEIFDDPMIVITVKKSLEACSKLEQNFRYEIMANIEDDTVKGYKANRVGMEVPRGLNEVYEWALGLPNTFCMSGVEADDVVVYYGLQGDIVCALDKDVLKSLPYAYDYYHSKWTAYSEVERKRFPYYQCITGDTGDGLRGVYRVGPKKADAALAGKHTEYEMWTAVVKQYIGKNQTIEEAIATMRAVRMDQWTEKGGLVLWTPPTKD